MRENITTRKTWQQTFKNLLLSRGFAVAQRQISGAGGLVQGAGGICEVNQQYREGIGRCCCGQHVGTRRRTGSGEKRRGRLAWREGRAVSAPLCGRLQVGSTCIVVSALPPDTLVRGSGDANMGACKLRIRASQHRACL